MSFDFDPTHDNKSSLPELDRIDTHEGLGERPGQHVRIRIDYDLCDDTGACVMVCPENVLGYSAGQTSVLQPEACTECWLCVENCPLGAIDLT
jgi:NAD-dependent dihydropyrimidine dehydrogenase PreA subunit